jgi:ssDNA-binding Zn-finger/Zn-ribbon topoisomerase 1
MLQMHMKEKRSCRDCARDTTNWIMEDAAYGPIDIPMCRPCEKKLIARQKACNIVKLPKQGYVKCPNCGNNTLHKSTRRAESGKIRWECNFTPKCYRTTNPDAPARNQNGKPKIKEAKLEFKAKTSNQTLVVTWAQNATPIHPGFFAALSAYCAERKAQLLVIPGRYKNATSQWTASQEDEQWWDPPLTPFLHNQRTKLNKNLVLLGDISTQPTAAAPLSGFEGITHGESGILGHPKLQMVVIPTPHHRLPKIMTTTGACTVENYTDSKAGKKGEFHHVIGAVVLELDGGAFHLRHLNARGDGAFCDLDRAYYPDGSVRDSGPYQGLVFGDAHPDFADPTVVAATFGLGSLVERLNPKTLVFHDLMDSYAVNPHHIGNPFISSAKRSAGNDNVAVEVQNTIQWLIGKSEDRQAVVVPSNHDDMLSRWIKNADWKYDTINGEFYLETALHMLRGTKMTKTGTMTPDPFQYWVKRARQKNIRCLRRNESFTIAGIECSLHGHEGPNGARGTMKNLSKLGVKVISGHSHTPGIEAGHYRTGTMTYLSLEYTGPIGSWLNAHVSIDPMGKRHIHICIDGRFWS